MHLVQVPKPHEPYVHRFATRPFRIKHGLQVQREFPSAMFASFAAAASATAVYDHHGHRASTEIIIDQVLLVLEVFPKLIQNCAALGFCGIAQENELEHHPIHATAFILQALSEPTHHGLITCLALEQLP